MEVVNNESVIESEVVEELATEEVVSETMENVSDANAASGVEAEPVYADCILYNRNEILDIINLLNNMEIRGVQNATVVARINEILDTHGRPVKVPVQTNGNM